MNADEIVSHPALFPVIQRQSRAFLQVSEEHPRLAAVFATHQRWLMAMVAVALYFRSNPGGSPTGTSTARFFEVIDYHSVASKNTASAFVKEMLNYGFASYGSDIEDKRTVTFHPTALSVDAIGVWLTIGLTTLDSLDGKTRLATFQAAPDGARRLLPLISDGLLKSRAVREPKNTFSLFSWLNEGGIVIERLITGMRKADIKAARISTDITSVTNLGMWLTLSRAHLARKLREAEDAGSLGWHGQKNHSVMWVSQGFLQDYMAAQAVKLAIIDASFAMCFGVEAEKSPIVDSSSAMPDAANGKGPNIPAAAPTGNSALPAILR
ncbi:hypothetical protein [Mesorhizobium sp. YR577]|uniref:hypothetical protein n=1 Tax=Mesorhizobium sp. YR577 TaxID=1884373 RepID=UPI0008F40CDB|nr:hypothetical protein [Mesorhizobium sp. YR577]SFU14247.1 hypothetical protein SAMN05518861_11527 [Mesorhizobium sp. YR577]